MKEPYPINILTVKIDPQILSIEIDHFITVHDYSPYLIMNKTTLNKLENFCIDFFNSMGIFKHVNVKQATIPKFRDCKILIDNSLNDGQVLLR